jgi:hypothetical protein
MNRGGDALVVWDQEVGADCTRDPASTFCVHIVQLAARTAGSAAWGAPIELSRPGVGAEPRGAIGAGGDAGVAWVHDIGDDRVLQATYRRGLSGSFPEPSDISAVVRSVRSHRVGVDGLGNAVLAWAERPLARELFDAMVAVRPASSGVWSAPVRLSSPERGAAAGPELAAAAHGLALVSWIETSGTVRVSSGDIAGGTWSAPVDVATGARTAVDPHVAVNEAGEAAVAWVHEAGPAPDVRVAYRTRAGSWAQPTSLGRMRAGSTARPSVAVSAGGEVVATWLAPGGIATATRSTTGTWRASTVTAPQAASVALALSASGNAVIGWTRASDGSVATSLRPASLETWVPANALSSGGASRLGLALDGAQRGVAVWNRAEGQRFAVEVADLEPRGPVLAHLRLPARAVVGSPGRFSVRPAAWAAPLAGPPRWTFGDGRRGSGARVAHAYARSGRYSVTVTQADATGAVTTARGVVRVIATRLRNRTRPWIQGTPQVGATLTCRRGRWTGSPPVSYAYAWRRDGRVIAGSTSSRHQVPVREAGASIDCIVRATNPAGSARAVSAPVRVRGSG